MLWNEKIKAKRKEYNVTQNQLASSLGIKRENYVAIENGKRKCSLSMQKKIETAIEKFNPKYRLYAVFDYFRVQFPTHDFKSVMYEVLHMKSEFFVNDKHGFYGYKETYSFSDIVIMVSDDSDSRGTLLELKGKGCRRLEYLLTAQGRSWKDVIIACLSLDGRFKRVDIAIDDTLGILNVPDLMKKVGTDECDTIFRTYQRISSSENLRNEVVDCKYGEGNTLYVGSFKSELYFCIYEKDFEQYIKNGIPIENADVKNRFEIRLKDERAKVALMDYFNYGDIERTAFGIINRYICFYEKDDKKDKADWDIDYRWSWFIGNGREPIRLTMQPEPYTIDKTRRWIINQISPSLSLLNKIDEFDGTHLVDKARKVRLPDKQKRIYEQYTSSVYDVITDDIDKKDINLFNENEVKNANKALADELASALRKLNQREDEIAYLRSQLKNKKRK